MFELTQGVGSAYRQNTCSSRKWWTKSRISLINCLILITSKLRASKEQTSTISCPLNSSIIFYQKNDARYKSKSCLEWRTYPYIMKLKVLLIELQLLQHQCHAVLLLLQFNCYTAQRHSCR